MSGRVELGPELIEPLVEACRRFVSIYDIQVDDIPDGVEAHMNAPPLLQAALADVLACAGVVYARFPPGSRILRDKPAQSLRSVPK